MSQYQNLVTAIPLSWGSGSTFSGSVYLNGAAILAVGVPGTWTTAPLTFQVSADPAVPGTWLNLYSGTVEVTTYPATAGTAMYYLDVASAPGVYWLRGRSGNAAAGTAQQAARDLTLLVRPV